MKILITGASGFIGTALYKKLSCDFDLEVHVLSRTEIIFPKVISHVVKNYSDEEEIIDVVKNIQPEIIIHAGADMDATTSENSFLPERQAGTKNIWNTSTSFVKKFIFLSSIYVYAPSENFIDEESELKPWSVYGEAKRKDELFLEKEATEKNISTLVIRLSSVIGLGERGRKATTKILNSVLQNEIAELNSSNEKRDYIDVKDVVSVISTLVKKDFSETKFQYFNLCSGKSYSASEIYFQIIKPAVQRLGIAPVENLISNESKINYSLVSNNKLLEILPTDFPFTLIEESIQSQLAFAVRKNFQANQQIEKYFSPDFLKEATPDVDMHVHTNQTDGQDSIEEMLIAASNQKIKYLVFTEHVRKTSAWFEKFFDEINNWRNNGESKMKVLIGTEAAIRTLDGDIDISNEILQRTELSMASYHTSIKNVPNNSPSDFVDLEFRASFAAVANPAVDVLGHPMAMSLKKGYTVPENYFLQLAEQCKRHNKLYEINLSYHYEILEMLWNIVLKTETRILIGGNTHSKNEIAKNLNYFYSIITK